MMILEKAEAKLFACCSLLVTFCLLLLTFCLLLVTFCPVFMGNWPTINHTCYPYLPNRLSIFSSLVLLKEMKTRSESKISSCCFCVSRESRELGDRESPRLPCVTPGVESSSDLFRGKIS